MLEFFRESPFFMNRPQTDCGTFCQELVENRDRCFARVMGKEANPVADGPGPHPLSGGILVQRGKNLLLAGL